MQTLPFGEGKLILLFLYLLLLFFFPSLPFPVFAVFQWCLLYAEQSRSRGQPSTHAGLLSVWWAPGAPGVFTPVPQKDPSPPPHTPSQATGRRHEGAKAAFAMLCVWLLTPHAAHYVRHRRCSCEARALLALTHTVETQ